MPAFVTSRSTDGPGCPVRAPIAEYAAGRRAIPAIRGRRASVATGRVAVGRARDMLRRRQLSTKSGAPTGLPHALPTLEAGVVATGSVAEWSRRQGCALT